MDWLHKKYYSGQTRTIRKFLWLPKYIKGRERWLENATFRQYYVTGYLPCDSYWRDLEWVD